MPVCPESSPPPAKSYTKDQGPTRVDHELFARLGLLERVLERREALGVLDAGE